MAKTTRLSTAIARATSGGIDSGGWYWLSYYDMSFGIYMFTRQVHDLTFQLYGKALGIPPES
ncbi:DUF6105 family protein, partial [Rhizobium ruizarguesonis]